MKHLFIINPVAGKRESTLRLEEEIRALEVDWEVVYTTGEGDAQRFAHEAVQSGQPIRIYACGGDGTLNEVVNGAAGCDHAAITNVPLGTGNDFLKIFGPANKKRFADLKALAEGPQAAMDLVDCNGKLGIGVACTGVDARIAADVHHFKTLPLVRGKGAYIMALILNLLFKRLSCYTNVKAGDYQCSGETTLICVCNGRYYGGGFMPIGNNLPNDGKIESLVITKVGFFTFLRLVGEYSKGNYHKFPHLIRPGTESEITVDSGSQEELVAVVDGEVMRSPSFTFRLSEKKVNFFYPGDLNYQPQA